MNEIVISEVTITTPIEEKYTWDNDQNHCYLCGGQIIDNCYDCDRPICKKHVARTENHFCGWKSNHCKNCPEEKENG